eukprot:TRINITY_DN2358_c0_g2_i1.p1 TRINITY_DN2358_c0_g2~~TRINITY_DN2358_c0_g2_i1.p1  ORF type:complete len:267 (+),score=1.71 TRINITY_DN2358_c0_g2_i1:229-1029(+)
MSVPPSIEGTRTIIEVILFAYIKLLKFSAAKIFYNNNKSKQNTTQKTHFLKIIYVSNNYHIALQIKGLWMFNIIQKAPHIVHILLIIIIFATTMRKIQLITLLLIMFNIANAQLPILRNFTATKYNSGTQNWCITQSNDGRMIFANNSGLLEFDGDQWISKPISNYTNVRAVLYDDKRNIVYAGSTGEFGYYQLDPITSRLIYKSISSHLPAKEKDFSEIWNIYPVSYTHLRAHETRHDLVCRLLLEKKKKKKRQINNAHEKQENQ